MLLAHVLATAIEPNAKAACRAIVASAISSTARTWWERLGFEPLASPATEIAAQLPISRQAIAKHLDQLRRAQLVDAHRTGRETRFEATPAPLNDAVAWVAEVGAHSDERPAALGDAARRG